MIRTTEERGVRAPEWPALTIQCLAGLDFGATGERDSMASFIGFMLSFILIKQGGNDSPKRIRCSRALKGHLLVH